MTTQAVSVAPSATSHVSSSSSINAAARPASAPDSLRGRTIVIAAPSDDRNSSEASRDLQPLVAMAAQQAYGSPHDSPHSSPSSTSIDTLSVGGGQRRVQHKTSATLLDQPFDGSDDTVRRISQGGIDRDDAIPYLRPTPSSNTKFFAYLFIVAALIAVVVAGYFLNAHFNFLEKIINQ